MQPLESGLEELALTGTQFEDAVITTRNSGALISGQGGYCAFQPAHTPWRLSHRRVNIRVSPDSNLRLSRSQIDLEERIPGSIVATDRDGTIVHRIQYVMTQDRLVAEALTTKTADGDETASDDPTSGNVPSLVAVRAARDTWDTAGATAHLNDLISRDSGRQRRQCLPHVGRNRAWKVRADVIPSFLIFLCDRKTGYARMVPGPGIVQADLSPITQVTKHADILVASGAGSIFSIDLDSIESAWVTACGMDWQIELYARDKRAIAILGFHPMENIPNWRDLLTSLPCAA
ncbi:MAG: hypothetical protein AAF557_23395 [Pseudomonadota bacterium]